MTDLSTITPEQEVKIITEVSNPPLWLRYWIYWFRIGLSIFLLISVLFGIGGCSLSAATVPWQEATAVVPVEVAQQVIQENTDLDAKEAAKNMLAWSIEGKDGKLAVFNFNTPDMCGRLGCLYAGYWLRKEQPISEVFLRYLNPNLPPGKALLQVGESRDRALPCIKILQMEDEQLRQLNFCFNGDRYLVVDSQLVGNPPASDRQTRSNTRRRS